MRGLLKQRLVHVLAYAYTTLALYVLFRTVLRLLFHDGGWINEFLVFLMLSGPFALVPIFRRLRRKQLVSD